MYATEKERHDAMKQSARHFDIHSEESEMKAAAFVDELTGDGDETPEDEENINGFEQVPLSGAIATAQLAQVPAFQSIHAAIKDLHAQCVEKSKSEKESADFRNLNHAKGLGIEQVLGVINAALEESAARLKSASPDERRAMGSEANTFINDLITAREPIIVGPSSEEKTSPRPPSAGVQMNTKAAQEWLKTHASRD
jgi:hypothetical protein